jgi:hypothetical protein
VEEAWKNDEDLRRRKIFINSGTHKSNDLPFDFWGGFHVTHKTMVCSRTVFMVR